MGTKQDKKRVIKNPETRGTKRAATLLLTQFILLTCEFTSPTNAILNCFTPSMFKMNKDNQALYSSGANWYPSHLPQQTGGYPMSTGYGAYGYNPMKLLFQPKWKSGSLFGPKAWNSWKMGANSNFYRPNYGYAVTGQSPTTGYSGYNDQLNNVAQYTLQSPLASAYTSNPNDGWSSPVVYNQQQAAPIQQTQLSSYGTAFTHLPPKQLQQITSPLQDPYATKGLINSKLTSSTTKSALQANGGYYPSYDSFSQNKSYGYSYPNWYTGVVESPAKIAQQLMKIGMKNQRLLLQQQQQNRTAPLMQESKLTILDEPRFVGYGTLDLLTNKEARLSCSFNEAIDQTNLPLWVKFMGPYNSSRVVDTKVVPPFNCASNNCRTQEIETSKDFRYRFDNGPATSTLIITEPRLSDYGTYRCSALTKAINNNPLETIYQIVQFGGLN